MNEFDNVIIPDGFQFGEVDENTPGYVPPQIRTEQEIMEYLEEAFDKVWLMRSYDFGTGKTPYIEAQQPAEIILSSYNDIPEDGYNDWECGFWNGILATLRWALGEDEKDFLDT